LAAGCTEATATAGVAASEERGIGGSLSDAEITAQINYAWLDRNPDVGLWDRGVLLACPVRAGSGIE